MTLLSADLANPTGYGRVLRKNAKSPEVRAIVEEKTASAAQKKIREINSGFYVFSVPALYEHVGELSTNNRTASITSLTWLLYFIAPAKKSCA